MRSVGASLLLYDKCFVLDGIWNPVPHGRGFLIPDTKNLGVSFSDPATKQYTYV